MSAPRGQLGTTNLSELFSAYNISLDADRASSAATNHALQLAATDLEYEVTRVKSPVLGRDLNPLGRGDGTYYCNGGNRGGSVAMYHAKPAFAGNIAGGFGNGANNQEDGGDDCERDYDAFLRLDAAGLCKREVLLMDEICCETECAAERAGMRPISQECKCCMCKGCGTCSVPDPCCCCPEDDEDREQQQQSCQNCMPYGPDEPGCPNPWAPEIPPPTDPPPGDTVSIAVIVCRLGGGGITGRVQGEGVPSGVMTPIRNWAINSWDDLKRTYRYCKRRVCCWECIDVSPYSLMFAVGAFIVGCFTIGLLTALATKRGFFELVKWGASIGGRWGPIGAIIGGLAAGILGLVVSILLNNIIEHTTKLYSSVLSTVHTVTGTTNGAECFYCIMDCMFGFGKSGLATLCAQLGMTAAATKGGQDAMNVALASIRRKAFGVMSNLKAEGFLDKAA